MSALERILRHLRAARYTPWYSAPVDTLPPGFTFAPIEPPLTEARVREIVREEISSAAALTRAAASDSMRQTRRSLA